MANDLANARTGPKDPEAHLPNQIFPYLAFRDDPPLLNYVQNAEAEATAIAANLTTKSIAICADVGIIDGPKALIEAAAAEFGQIDILVNTF
ncbi:hypothetical protein BGZ63DRAFT_425395 [Mariannaea sp. PMI_226]|nr:hypothetical protein BGZ63DRAFT_425395 [Mariannaea sp. PMI_226]